MSYAATGAALGRSVSAIRNHRYELRLPKKAPECSEAEIAAIRTAYGADRRAAIDLAELARRLGRAPSNVAAKARKLGLTNSRRKKRITAAFAAARRAQWRGRPYPRGMAGKAQTARVREMQRARFIERWAADKASGTGWMDEEARQRRSDAPMELHADGTLRGGHSRAKGGKRADLGDRYFRSAWEANIALSLDWLKERGEIADWSYEPDTFWFEAIKRGVRSYTPDFRIADCEGDDPYYWEVKGYDHSRGKTARQRMAKYYPDITVVLIDPEAYRAIAKWSRVIPNWEYGERARR